MLAIRFHQKSDILKEKVQKNVISSKSSFFFDRIWQKRMLQNACKLETTKTDKTFELISGAKIVHFDGFT